MGVGEDPALVNAIGKLDTKHFAKLVEDLETLRLSRGELLSARGDALQGQFRRRAFDATLVGAADVDADLEGAQVLADERWVDGHDVQR